MKFVGTLVSVAEIAAAAGVSIADAEKALRSLQRRGILRYTPAASFDKPAEVALPVPEDADA